MERKEELTEVLNDLVRITNDRIKQYMKASRVISDFACRTIFMSTVDESRKFGMDLSLLILKLGEMPRVRSTTHAGKIYRIWSEIRDSFTGRDIESVLNACEFIEDAVQKAYIQALRHEDMTEPIRQLISRQLEDLRLAYQRIERCREWAQPDYFFSAGNRQLFHGTHG